LVINTFSYEQILKIQTEEHAQQMNRQAGHGAIPAGEAVLNAAPPPICPFLPSDTLKALC
jgi:hypothetical protein